MNGKTTSPPTELLKVGDLARRSGLTVRALHHFDQIGLLQPSARSEAGYRLYNRDDVARLHALQSLRALGVPLKQIGGLLKGDGSDLPAIVARQMRALDNEIAQATALRQRLQLLAAMLASGRQPEVDDWLGVIGLMNTYAHYFNADEIRRIVGNWPRVAEAWPKVLAQLQAAKDRGLPPSDPQVQALVQQWMGLMHHWLDGDFDLMSRWGAVHVNEPQVRGPSRTTPGLARYVQQASDLRMALWQRHFALEELSRFRPLGEGSQNELALEVDRALARRLSPTSAGARRLGRRWLALLVQAVGGDPALAQRLVQAYVQHPALRAGSRLSPPQLDFLLAVVQASPSA